MRMTVKCAWSVYATMTFFGLRFAYDDKDPQNKYADDDSFSPGLRPHVGEAV